MAKLYNDADPDKLDPKVEEQAETVAKKNGFANLAEHDVVSMNISMIMSGIDPDTKKFTEPPEQIREQIASLKADNSVPEVEKQRLSGAAGGRAQECKAYSVQGKHRAGAEVLR